MKSALNGLWVRRMENTNPALRAWLDAEYERVKKAYDEESMRRTNAALDGYARQAAAEAKIRELDKEQAKQAEWPLPDWGVVTGWSHPELEGQDGSN